MASNRNYGMKAGIQFKLISLVGICVTVFGATAFYSYRCVQHLSGAVYELGENQLTMTQKSADMRASVHAIARFLWIAHAFPPGEERAKYLEKSKSYRPLLEGAIKSFETFQHSSDVASKFAVIKEMAPKLFSYQTEVDTQLSAGTKAGDAEARNILTNKFVHVAVPLTDSLVSMGKIMDAEADVVMKDSIKLGKDAIQNLLMISIFAGAGLILFGVIFSARLAKALMRITDAVYAASSQVSAASSQLSNASEQLSSTSQEQASSIEETSASLTEIAGMVEANVKGAEQANECSKEAHGISGATRLSMDELRDAMNSILESNSRIEKLVKVIEEIGEKTEVIDDIVFKTQLLSFNASVEAERAGEHGRGFAVVAQEVGNLAQMSGKAATEISGIVKQSIKEAEEVARENKARVESGGSLAKQTRDKMTHVMEKLGTVLETTGKIVNASREQSQGISQISTSVDSLNQTTQETASTAEESAAAGEELNAQAQSLLSLVNQLREIVTGSSEVGSHTTIKQTIVQPVQRAHSQNVVSLGSHPRKYKPSQGDAPFHGLKKAAGAEVLSNSPTSSSEDAWEKL